MKKRHCSDMVYYMFFYSLLVVTFNILLLYDFPFSFLAVCFRLLWPMLLPRNVRLMRF